MVGGLKYCVNCGWYGAVCSHPLSAGQEVGEYRKKCQGRFYKDGQDVETRRDKRDSTTGQRNIL